MNKNEMFNNQEGSAGSSVAGKSKKLFVILVSVALAAILISGFVVTGVLTYPAFLDPMAPYRMQAISEFDIREDCNVYSVDNGYFLVDSDGMAATARANSNLAVSTDGKSVLPSVGVYGWVKFCFNAKEDGVTTITVSLSRDKSDIKLTDYYTITLNNETIESDAAFIPYSKRSTNEFDTYVLGDFAVKQGVNIIRFECKPIKNGGDPNEYTTAANVLYGFRDMTLSGQTFQWATYANMRTRTGHRLLYMLGKDADCTEEGSYPYYKCLDEGCNKIFSDDMATQELAEPIKIPVDPSAHTSAQPPADCTQTGVCSRCGKTYHGPHSLGEQTFDTFDLTNGSLQAVQKLSCTHCGDAATFTMTNRNRRRPETDVKVENPGVPAGTANITRLHTAQETLWTDSKEITLENGSKMMTGGRVTVNLHSDEAKTVDLYLAMSCPQSAARVSDAFSVTHNGKAVTSNDVNKQLKLYNSASATGPSRFYEYYQYRIGTVELTAGKNTFVIDQMTTDMIPTATKTVYLKGLYMLGDTDGVRWDSEKDNIPVEPVDPDNTLLEFVGVTAGDKHVIASGDNEVVQKYTVPSGSYAKNFFVTDGNSLRAETDVLLKDAVAGDEAVNKNPKPDKINANYEAFHAERGASSTLQFNVTSDIATEAELYLYVSSCTNNNASIALKDLYSAYKDGAKITSPNYEATETVALNTNTVTASKSYFEYYGYYIGRVRLAQGANTIEVKHHSPSMDDGGLNGNYLKGIILAGDVDGLTWASGKDPVSEFEPAEPVLSSIEISKLPNKRDYSVGESFDPTGMEVTAHYTEGKASEIVTGYTYAPDGALGTSNDKITVSYTENGVIKTATVNITVTDPDAPAPEPIDPLLDFIAPTEADRNQLNDNDVEVVQKYNVSPDAHAKNFFITDGASLRPESDIAHTDKSLNGPYNNQNPKNDTINTGRQTFNAERGSNSTLKINLYSDVTAEVEIYLYVSCCSNANKDVDLSDIYSVHFENNRITSSLYEDARTVKLATSDLTASRLFLEYYGFYIGKISLKEGNNELLIKHHAPSDAEHWFNGTYLKGFILAGDVDGVTWASEHVSA